MSLVGGFLMAATIETVTALGWDWSSALSCFFFVAHCLVREAIELLLVLLSIYSYIPCRTQGPTAPKQCHDFYLQRKLKIICGADYWCHKSFYLRCK
jgi:hypothetical protein